MILNYTPHAVDVILESGEIKRFVSVGNARCKEENKIIRNIAGIPISSITFGEVEGLPEEQEGTYYIVSRLITQTLPNRKDLLVPNDLVRDKEGRIIGCKSLSIN